MSLPFILQRPGQSVTPGDYFTRGELAKHLKDTDLVESFIALANSGQL